MGSSPSFPVEPVNIPYIHESMASLICSHISSFDRGYENFYDSDNYHDVNAAIKHPSNFKSGSQAINQCLWSYAASIIWSADPTNVHCKRQILLFDAAAIRFEEQVNFVETNDLFPDIFKSAFQEVFKHISTIFLEFQFLTTSLTNNQVIAAFSDDAIHLILKSEQSDIKIQNQLVTPLNDNAITSKSSCSSVFSNSFKEMMVEQTTPVSEGYHVDHVLSLYLVLAIFSYISRLPRKIHDTFEPSILQISNPDLNYNSCSSVIFSDMKTLLNDPNVNAQAVSPGDHLKFREYDMILIKSLDMTPNVIKGGPVTLTGKQKSLSLTGDAAQRFLLQCKIVFNYFPEPFQKAFASVFVHVKITYDDFLTFKDANGVDNWNYSSRNGFLNLNRFLKLQK